MLKLMVSGKQMLVMLLPIYNGMEVGFIFAEMTRAYSACVLGLDKVSASCLRRVCQRACVCIPLPCRGEKQKPA